MIIRIVKLEIKEENVVDFLELFDAVKAKIVGFDGCSHVELWQDANDEGRVFTYSHWESDAHLDKYRYSQLFSHTWEQAKLLFRAQAQAWSTQKINEA